ncbi:MULTISPECIES: response regulator [unclassified Polaromonas]|uniref:response regulator n=1 Tax=unclassified Polaromonas TaxID=2638319 RepID=UPI0018CA239E|nr:MULTISPECIES: response regulator [unclassified Polaromonas]MBG6072971.1 signal transduction histidine kinase/DNA-binding response OmpR family regulator [Polaromonas sp. CG_9.7]MBG6114879.1 signal transduction histidine kinase/DNA-binding response OmpR family regulator [Polaromonas sp. CG_9.2]MDH6183601.1 signal transduction histidine kinase/DNA-binding response OmpR family regulator [Polaromonas sp. CG_23.6]
MRSSLRPPKTFSLRTVLIASLLLFSLLPAATVGWFLYRSNVQSVQLLSGKIIEDMTERIKTDVEGHLAQAHVVLNGMVPAQPDASAVLRARQLIASPELFEQAAFAMTRMTPDVPRMYLGSQHGDFLAIDASAQDATALVRVSERQTGGEGRRFFMATSPGDRRVELPAETSIFEPRNRPWYQAAMENKERVFTPISVSANDPQLRLTLAQPVYGADGGSLGVLAVDLPLKRLNQMLQGMRISSHGTVFLLDEQGFYVASSTGDKLFSNNSGVLQRYKPLQSRNAIIRQAYGETLSSLGKTLESSVQRVSFLRRIPIEGDTLVVALKPFGESIGVRWSLVVAAPESDFTAATRAALKETLAVTALILALGALLAIALAWRLSLHFRRLGEAAALLAQHEVLPTYPASRIDEVRRLSRSLHDSAQELKRNRSEIEAQTVALHEANETLEERVTSRTAELNASRDEALGAARAKAAFLAAMSHEIRTPLNGVVGMTTLLADTPLDAEQRDYVHTMRISSDQLLGVINDVLDFSKIESGKLELEDEALNLLATIEEACDIGAPRAREKGLELLVDLGDDLPGWARGDVTRLRQVLLNLVNNAVKFTDNGQVVVSARMLQDFGSDQRGLIEFRIKDSGIGIEPDRQTGLFQSFVQVDASTTRKYGGTGLGLAICKRLVKLMGGQIGMESAPGEGSTFWFTARLGHAEAPEVAMLSDLHLVSLAGKQVVVVDDTPLNLRILDKQLRRWGMTPVLFERAAEALDWLAGQVVDVVISDMHMPEMDGLDFARLLRERMPATPIVLLTSGTMPTGETARVFDARLLKPYRQSQLFEALARVTSASAAIEKISRTSPIVFRNQFILVADDNAINLKVALAMLTKLGYEAATAVNGREAVEMVDASLRTGLGDPPRQYAAILMDANMPVMDGYVASRLILAAHGASAPPLIALTASVLEEDRQRCLQAGMIGFLPKPLRMDELSEALARYARQPGQEIAPEPIAPVTQDASAGLEPEPLLIDWSRLEQFREFDDEDLSMTREVMMLFITEMPQRTDDIRRALAACDSAVLSQAAHALKGAASNVGAQSLSDACAALEHACLQGLWPADAALQVARLLVLAERSCQSLEDWPAAPAAV